MTELPSFDLSGKVALVTGAARGLGRAIALALAGAGADLALGLRDAGADGGLADEIAAMGRRALRLQMDVTDLPQAYAAIDRAVAELGRIDILVNNAGGGIDDRALDVKRGRFRPRHRAEREVDLLPVAARGAAHDRRRSGAGGSSTSARRPGSWRFPASRSTAWRRRRCRT